MDTETAGQERLELVLGCYEVWIVDDTGLPLGDVEKGTFNTEAEFYQIISKYVPARVIAHNWRFDASVLRIGATENIERYQYTIDVESSIIPVDTGIGFTPFLVTLLFKNGKSELICNTNFYKTSLDSIGDSFDIPKLDMPVPEDYIDRLDYLLDLETYCQRDVEILRRGWFFLFEFVDHIGEVTPGVTVAMCANRVYRNKFMPGIRIEGTLSIPYVSNAEVEAYKGGRTDCFYKGTPDVETVYKYDVNSLYPHSMLGDIPTRYVQKAPSSELLDTLDGEETRFTYLSDITIHIPPDHPLSFIGAEGFRNEKRELLFPVGTFRTWVWLPMIKILYKYGYIQEIHNVFAYNKYPIFDRYVTTLYERREHYKKIGDKPRDILVKTLLNSLYGKFGQRQHPSWNLADDEEYEIMYREARGIERFRDFYDDILKEYMQIGNSLYYGIPSNGDPNKRSVLSVAGHITTQARAILWDAMRVILQNGGELYYCDTDSIFSSIPLPANMVSQTELGKWKLEDTIDARNVEFISPKHYMANNKWTIKGIRNPSNAKSFEQNIFPNFMTDLTSKNPKRRERLDMPASIGTIVKSPTGINSKRIEVKNNFPTFPIVMT